MTSEARARLIFVTQTIDPSDPVLGFAVDLVRALSKRFEKVVVIANTVAEIPSDLGAEVISLGKEDGAGRLRRGARYERALVRTVRHIRPDALLAHMCPAYLNLAAPICRAAGVRLLLWFAHPATSPTLALAEKLADRVLTPLPGAFPRRSRKLRAIGQAIDVEAFPLLSEPSPPGPFRLLSIGRTSPVKGYPTVLRAVRALRDSGDQVELRIVGPSTTWREVDHRRELEKLIARLGVATSVTLERGVAHERVASFYGQADALVSATIQGSGDKAVMEAASSGLPVLVSNPVFGPLVGDLPVALSFQEDDHEDLATRIRELINAPPSVRGEVGSILRSRIEQDHSIEGWATRVHETVVGLRGGARTPVAASTNGPSR